MVARDWIETPPGLHLRRFILRGRLRFRRIASAILFLSTSTIATPRNTKQTVFRSRMRYVQQTFIEHGYHSEGVLR